MYYYIASTTSLWTKYATEFFEVGKVRSKGCDTSWQKRFSTFFGKNSNTLLSLVFLNDAKVAPYIVNCV